VPVLKQTQDASLSWDRNGLGMTRNLRQVSQALNFIGLS
jgi:hypothetical protein